MFNYVYSQRVHAKLLFEVSNQGCNEDICETKRCGNLEVRYDDIIKGVFPPAGPEHNQRNTTVFQRVALVMREQTSKGIKTLFSSAVFA